MRFERRDIVSPRHGVQRKRPEAGGWASVSTIDSYGQPNRSAGQPARPFLVYSPGRSKVEYRPLTFRPQIVGQHCCTAVQLGAFLAGKALARVKNSGQHGSISLAE